MSTARITMLRPTRALMLQVVKRVARKIPLATASYRLFRRIFFKSPTTEDIFTGIAARKDWQGISSVSGSGSDARQTQTIVRELPTLLKTLKVKTMLDIPCGDFHWMKSVNLQGIKYLGLDIVKDLIRENDKYQTKDIRFGCIDIISNSPPKADLILCRDCLVHLPFADAIRALQNICDSGSTYLLTTSFLERTENQDIAKAGWWRPLNLERAPFNFPAPLLTIVEGCTENDGIYYDKSLALWRISDLRTTPITLDQS